MERTRSIQIRLTEEEFARLRDDAEELGTTMSDLVRTSVEVVERVAENDGRVPDVILVDTLTIMRIDLELNRWGVNFNLSSNPWRYQVSDEPGTASNP